MVYLRTDPENILSIHEWSWSIVILIDNFFPCNQSKLTKLLSYIWKYDEEFQLVFILDKLLELLKDKYEYYLKYPDAVYIKEAERIEKNIKKIKEFKEKYG